MVQRCEEIRLLLGEVMQEEGQGQLRWREELQVVLAWIVEMWRTQVQVGPTNTLRPVHECVECPKVVHSGQHHVPCRGTILVLLHRCTGQREKEVQAKAAPRDVVETNT